MTKNEILAEIANKIAGQGSQVDTGGALAKILTEINNAAFAGANVQSDWDENDNTKPDFIKNKPTIPAAQVQSDWAQDDPAEPDYIKNKPFNSPLEMYIRVSGSGFDSGVTKEVAARSLGISEAELDALMGGKITAVQDKETLDTYLCISVHNLFDTEDVRVIFYGIDREDIGPLINLGWHLVYDFEENLYYALEL